MSKHFDYPSQALFCAPYLEVMGRLTKRISEKKLTLKGVSDALLKEIRHCELYLSQHGFPKEEINSGIFAVCAWCDEQIMNAGWSGISDRWSEHLLQRHFFKTTLAGELFFEHLDELKKTQSPAFSIYAFCLFYGFKGKYVYDLHLHTLDLVRSEAATYVLQRNDLNRRDSQTFPSLSSISDAMYLPWKDSRGLVITFSLLLFFAFLTSTLSGLINSYLEKVIRVW